MGYLLLPEIALKNILEKILLYIRNDCRDNAMEDQLLYKLLSGLVIEKYNFYQQSLEIFYNRNVKHPRYLQINNFFNAERAHLPSVHLVLADEMNGIAGLGLDENFVQSIVNNDNTETEIYTRSANTRLVLIVTSDNTYEVICIYHVLRACLISVLNDLQFQGIQNPKISGGDININSEFIPQNIFLRSLNLDFFYEISTPKLFSTQTFVDLVVEGIPIDENTNDESS